MTFQRKPSLLLIEDTTSDSPHERGAARARLRVTKDTMTVGVQSGHGRELRLKMRLTQPTKGPEPFHLTESTLLVL